MTNIPFSRYFMAPVIYNLAVDHSPCILGTAMSHLGTWNDKTLILSDDLICMINNKDTPGDFKLMLHERN